MAEKLKILIVEDNPDDALLILRALKKEGYQVDSKIVETAKAMDEALSSEEWDLVISDFAMPKFSGAESLALFKSKHIDIPFILVSGTVGEDIAVEMMRSGAHDYIMKTNLKRIVPAIQRELKEVVIRQQRKKALEDLRKSEEQYRTLINYMSEGLLQTDLKDKILFANQRFCDILGYSNDELIGKIATDFLIHSEDKKITQEKNILRARGISDKYELRLIKKNGDIIWSEISGSPVYDKNGIVIGSIGLFTDITQKYLAEIALKESEQKFRGLVERISDIILILDKNDVVTFATNSSIKILGFDPFEMIGKKAENFLLGEQLAKVKESMERNRFGYSVEVEVEIIRKDGSLAIIEFQGSPIFSDNKFNGIQVVGRDVTKRKEMENQLKEAMAISEESSRLKSSLLANVSHELRTPMTGILGMAQILMEELKDSHNLETVKKIHKSGMRLMNTLNSILDLSELESNASLLVIKDYYLPSKVKYLLTQYENFAYEKNLAFSYIIKDPSISAIVDERLMNQIIINIVDNAIKYTHKGSIEIIVDSIESEDGLIAVLSIKDTGIGISRDKQKLIFHEFRQVSEGFSRKYEGAGLGLTIAKKMVELMDGRITVESDVNVGSIFSIYFPGVRIVDDSITQLVQKNNQTNNMLSARNLNILLVEDNEINAEVITKFIDKIAIIDNVPSGVDALNAIKNNKYDVILMDINLGAGLDGVSTAKLIRETPGYENVKIVAITGYAMSEDKERFLELGFNYYISKPFTRIQINDLLKNIIEDLSKKI